MPADVTRDVDLAAAALAEGRLVAIPTETVYGLGGNALDPNAVAKIFQAKNRPHFDPLIVHLADPGDLDQLVSEIPQTARILSERFWPGPLTLVLPKRDHVPDLVTAGLGSVAVRVPRLDLTREVIRRSGVPIAAPSANPFGGISPTTAEHVLQGLGDQIDLILDGGPCRIGVESTVLAVPSNGPPVLLRPGGLPVEDIEAVIGEVGLPDASQSSESSAQASPGMLSRHYAPATPLQIVEDWSDGPAGANVGVLTFSSPPATGRYARVEVLSEAGSLTEAAAEFFAALRRLDASGVERIVANRFPDQGLGRALNDRLKRAATP